MVTINVNDKTHYLQVKSKILFKKYLLLHVYFFLPAFSLCTMCNPGTYGGQKRM